ncbi:MAG: GNAT family N-acetyltransferase [Gammaproteobacteria bacterium]|nr:GNAT family N-acetyltransferase [Gammaproteobacteria bacterium]MCP5424088.1 GNAT family N-acetyltransferase [Gammaproteobacteria bacterium]MCP5459483.1 GNAT family N-acetyltransferase [Gammaproteobacteria bacterium]
MDLHPVDQEKVTVAGGARFNLRRIRADDKAKLYAGFQRLSLLSRYRRFFSSKAELSPEDLRFLTEFDAMNHLALGLFELDDHGVEGDTIGVGRYIRDPDDPAIAEFSLAVADEYHSQGFGRLLLERLLSTAADNGIKRLQGYLLPDNTQVAKLIKKVRHAALMYREDGLTKACVPTLDIPETVIEQWPSQRLGEMH